MSNSSPHAVWAAMPVWARVVVTDAATETGVPAIDVLGDTRFKEVVAARHAAWARAKALKPNLSSAQLGKIFGVEPSTIRHALRGVASGKPRDRRGAHKRRPRVRHVKRGTVYVVIGKALLQSERPVQDYAEVVVYQGDDGQLWARPVMEFEDGRFEPAEEKAA